MISETAVVVCEIEKFLISWDRDEMDLHTENSLMTISCSHLISRKDDHSTDPDIKK